MDYKTRTRVSQILLDKKVPVGTRVIILGWIRTVRESKDVASVEVNDPLKDPDLIPSLVRRGYLVRTRTDAELEQARSGDVRQTAHGS